MEIKTEDIKLTGVVPSYAGVTKVSDYLKNSKKFSEINVVKKYTVGKLQSGKVNVTYQLKLKKENQSK
jgi:hypothetical protein